MSDIIERQAELARKAFRIKGDVSNEHTREDSGRDRSVRKIMKSTVATNCFGKECENDDCTVCVCERVIEIIRSHMNDVTDTNVGSKNNWIPCSERLPEDGEEMVLIQVSGKPTENIQFEDAFEFAYYKKKGGYRILSRMEKSGSGCMDAT